MGLLALLLTFGMVVGMACSSDSSSSSSSSTTAASNTTAASGSRPGTGPGTPAPKPLAEPATITVVNASNQEFLAGLILGIAMGEFEKENLTVERVTAPAAEGLILVAQGEVQLTFTGFPVAMFNMNAEQDSPVKALANVVLNEAPRQGWYIQKKYVTPEAAASGTATFDDIDIEALRNAVVTCGTSGQGWADSVCFPLWQWIKANGLTTDHFQSPLVLSNITDALIGLENGSVDMGLMITPVWLEMQGSDKCCVLIEGTNSFAASLVVANAEWIETEPDQVEAFMRALMRTYRTYLQGDYHKDVEVATVLAETFQRDLDQYMQTPSLNFDPNLVLDDEMLSRFQEMYRETNALNYSQDLTIDELADPSFVENILASG